MSVPSAEAVTAARAPPISGEKATARTRLRWPLRSSARFSATKAPARSNSASQTLTYDFRRVVSGEWLVGWLVG